MQVKVVERSQQIMLQEQEITRKEMELEATVKKPAEAERYRLERLAEAERYVTLPRASLRNVLYAQNMPQNLRAPVFTRKLSLIKSKLEVRMYFSSCRLWTMCTQRC